MLFQKASKKILSVTVADFFKAVVNLLLFLCTISVLTVPHQGHMESNFECRCFLKD